MRTNPNTICSLVLAIAAALAMSGCASSMQAPATALVAVSQAAVDSAVGAGGAEVAPLEMQSARDKLMQAQKAMSTKDYQRANDLAMQAQADAKLAQGMANSEKAKKVAEALQTDINVLREELARSTKQ